ncbi:MAG: putative immunity protein, partial [Chthoniobacterales bacterium]
MRDRRFVAAHRGGPLELDTHRLLAAWAARCAEHVVHFCPDARAQRAIEAAKMWAKGRISVGVARRAAIAAHAAARESRSDAARAAARAAGHAAATAHMADHSLGPALYGVKAAEAGTGS